MIDYSITIGIGEDRMTWRMIRSLGFVILVDVLHLAGERARRRLKGPVLRAYAKK